MRVREVHESHAAACMAVVRRKGVIEFCFARNTLLLNTAHTLLGVPHHSSSTIRAKDVVSLFLRCGATQGIVYMAISFHARCSALLFSYVRRREDEW